MGKNILLGVTGSIASYKACDLVGLLRKSGHSVRCVMSRDAKWFVTPLTLETLTGQKVVRDMFRLPENRDPVHVSLAEEADIILIAPATADVIGKIASGIADDILTCTICASACPVVFAPAMNDRMYNNPIVQDKMEYLRGKGYHFIDPVIGHLACGREGIGHLAPLERIVEETEKILAG
jgi:phosphopantothenoylcysteine decarboxylase/phosphopantothenate--cysteine ligase